MAFESIPTVMPAQGVLDKAFGRASKIEKSDRDRGHRWRKTVLAQFEAVRNIVDDTLGRYVRRFPSLDQVTPYHRELICLLIGEDEYRMNLGGVDRARSNCINLINRAMHEIRHETDVDVLGKTKRRVYGRTSNIVLGVDKYLNKLERFRLVLRRMPTVSAGLFTVVLAGHPNVGKSSLIRALTKAEPEVASYPFTTKAANVGHMEVEIEDARRASEAVVKIQLIDTPGLLDRPEDERNAIEHQAALAVRHLADLVIFLRDPTGHCGYPVDAQERLRAEIAEMIPEVPMWLVESKADLTRQAAEDTEGVRFWISTATNEGIDDLTEAIVEMATSKPKDTELERYLLGDTMPSHRSAAKAGVADIGRGINEDEDVDDGVDRDVEAPIPSLRAKPARR